MTDTAGTIIIEGVSYPIPGEDDWELVELAEFNRLRDKSGDMGGTIAIVWIAKHRVDPSFTIEQAERVKSGQIEEVEATEAPLDISDGSNATGSSSPAPSATPDDFGHLMLQGTTG